METQKSDCFVIADADLVIGFRLVGVEGIEVRTRDEALKAWTLCQKTRTKVVVVSSTVFDLIKTELNEWQSGGQLPLVVELPAFRNRGGPSRSLISAIREAVGMPV